MPADDGGSPGPAAALRESIAARSDEIAHFICDQIRVPTENPPGRRIREGLEVVADKLRELGIAAEIQGPDDACNLRAEIGSGPPRVYFHGHCDVVPAQDARQFEPEMTETTVTGRGSSDMKGGIASMVYALRALMEARIRLAGSVVLRIVPDEETGGERGSKALAARGELVEGSALAMLTAEPTGGLVWNASRGALSLRVTVRGKPSHVGLQYRGVNAFERMLPIAQALAELKREVETRRTAYPIESEAARRSILMLGGELAGGRNFNVVPSEVSFTVDRRTNPEEDGGRERQAILDIVESARSGGTDVTAEILQDALAAASAADSPAALALGRSIALVRDRPARFELCPGLLETRFYVALGVPALAFGPGLLTVSHGPEEFVRRADVEEVATIYALTAAELLAP